MRLKVFGLLFWCFLAAVAAQAKEATPNEDPVIKERFKELTSELRCLKCQNQTIYDSKAGLADDLRKQIRTQINAGKSNDEIIEYMVDRYGDFVRYRPAMNARTILLWVGPFLLLFTGISILLYQLRKRKTLVTDAPLSEEENMRLNKLLKEKGDR